MPEGDTIHRVAGVLGPELVNVAMARVIIRGVTRDELEGAVVTAITAVGKHMLIDFDRGWQIRVHLGMYGKWRRYRAPRPAPPTATLQLVTATDAFACLLGKEVELIARRDARWGRAVAALGPDVMAPDFDPMLAAARAQARGELELGVALLDQRIAAGIGNVYKSEVLYLEQESPFAKVGAYTTERLAALFACARRLMLPNLDPGPRVTLPGPRGGRGGRGPDDRYYVYNRASKPCRRCGTKLVTAVQGDALRRTYYCPTCQPTPVGVVPKTLRARGRGRGG